MVAVSIVVLAAYWFDEIEVCHIDGVNWEANNYGQIFEPPGCSGTGFQGAPYTSGGNYQFGSTVHESFELENNGSQPCYVSNLTVSFSAPPISGVSSNLPMTVPPGASAQLRASFAAPSYSYDWSIVIEVQRVARHGFWVNSARNRWATALSAGEPIRPG